MGPWDRTEKPSSKPWWSTASASRVIHLAAVSTRQQKVWRRRTYSGSTPSCYSRHSYGLNRGRLCSPLRCIINGYFPTTPNQLSPAKSRMSMSTPCVPAGGRLGLLDKRISDDTLNYVCTEVYYLLVAPFPSYRDEG